MWSLFRYVAQGFGWELGREAARSALDEARADAPEEPQPSIRAQARARRREEKAAKKRRNSAARAARRRDEAVEAELAALKKRVRKG